MKRFLSGNIIAIACTDIGMAVAALLFYAMWRIYDIGWLKSAYITFLTIFYHFFMRLAVGAAAAKICENHKFDLNSRCFRIYGFEPKLYKLLRVKYWKKFAVTANPKQFDLSKNNACELLHNIVQAEIVHRVIMVLSFIPLLLIIPYGAPIVFSVASIAACLIDLKYVIIQRYNRPRVLGIIKKAEKHREKIKS